MNIVVDRYLVFFPKEHLPDWDPVQAWLYMVSRSQVDLMVKSGTKVLIDTRTEIAKGPFSQVREPEWIWLATVLEASEETIFRNSVLNLYVA